MRKVSNHADHQVGPILALAGLMCVVTPVLGPVVLAQPPVTNPGWTFTGSLNTPRYLHTATLLPNGKVLVAGGFTGGTHIMLNSAELYEPATGAWSATGTLNIGRCWHTATLLPNGKVLVAGGLTSSAPASFTNSAELYDPATGTWSYAGNLNTDRAIHTATLLRNGKVLVAGGTNDVHNFAVDETTLNSAELYNPTTGEWSITSNLNTARDSHSATLLEDGKVLVAGGELSAEVYDPTAETWNSTGNLNVYGAAQVATLLPDGTVLVTGGWTGLSPLETAELYNPLTATWSRTGSLHSRRYHHTATVLYGGKVMVTGGDSGAGLYLNGVELYDQATGSWSSISSLAVARVSHTATVLPNGQVLVVGGYNRTTTLDSAELYIPSTAAPTLQFSTSRHSVIESGGRATISVVRVGDLSGTASVDYATSDGTALQQSDYTASFGTLRFAPGEENKAFTVPILDDGYVEGGESVLITLSNTNGAALRGLSTAILMITDNDTGLPVRNPTSLSTGKLKTARYLHTATLLPDSKVLVTGGYAGTESASVSVANSAELYEPVSGTWSVTGNLLAARVGHTATLLRNGKVLAAGGNGSTTTPSFGNTNSAELYDPRTGTWSATGNLNGNASWHTATLLQDGKVLVAGGWAGNSALKKGELYDPETGMWSLTGSLNAGRYGHTATLLADGKVLIAGGSDDGDLASTLASAELYDPDTGTWSSAGSLNTSRISHTATWLPDGKVLVAGGYDWPPVSLSSAELYDPITGRWTLTGKLNAARDSHTATLLPGGKVLLAGGYDWNRRSSLTTTELYDASTGEWSSLVGINTARRAHTATLLPSGGVLIAGGANWNDSLNSAELFDPGLVQSGTGAGVGTRLLIPSSVYSDEFVSSLVILNMDSEPNNVTIYASNHLGDSIGSMAITLRVGERFRTTNILQQLGAPTGSSGPILVSSNNGRLLSAMSEVVSSSRGAAGVLPAVNPEGAWIQGFLLEATDSGPRAMPGTYRTNLGLINTSGGSATNVTMTLFNSSGQQVGNPLTIPIGIDCSTGCPEQINAIVERLRGSAGLTEGYVRMSSLQPIIVWASKLENGTDDPSFQVGVGGASSDPQAVRSDVGTRLLVPSSVYSDAFTSSLVVLNMDSQPNSVTLTAYDTGGLPLAPPLTTTLPVGGQFRSNNILQQLGGAFGSFGPIKVESANNRLLSAVSEVRNNLGFGGFFPAVNVQTAWTQGFILEAMDSGPRGTPATYRTNLGLNSVGSGSTNVTITLLNDSGQQVGNSISTTVVSNGLTQLDSIVQRLRGSATVSGGYLRIVSSQPIIAWASKVENGTDDPSIQLGIGVSLAGTMVGTLVDLNGTYLAPSSGATFMDAIASATTHPLGDRRGQGQVYEVSKGVPAAEGTYTPFSDGDRRPHWLSGADLRGKSLQCDVDLHGLNLWNDKGGEGAEFFQIGAGRQADWQDTGTEEFFVFVYRYGTGFALYMETDWALYRPETTYYSAADETKFHVRVEVNAAGTEALLTVIPLNGAGAGTVHTVNPLPLDATNDNATSASFFAGFTQNGSNINSNAKATISNFVTDAVPKTADDR